MLLPFPQQELFQISRPPLPVTPARASPLLSSPSRPSRPGRSPVLGGLRGENVAGKELNRFPGRGQCPRCASPVPRAAGVGTAAPAPKPGAAPQRDPGTTRAVEGWGAPFPSLLGPVPAPGMGFSPCDVGEQNPSGDLERNWRVLQPRSVLSDAKGVPPASPRCPAGITLQGCWSCSNSPTSGAAPWGPQGLGSDGEAPGWEQAPASPLLLGTPLAPQPGEGTLWEALPDLRRSQPDGPSPAARRVSAPCRGEAGAGAGVAMGGSSSGSGSRGADVVCGKGPASDILQPAPASPSLPLPAAGPVSSLFNPYPGSDFTGEGGPRLERTRSSCIPTCPDAGTPLG